MLIASDDFATATVDDRVYVFGGMTGSRGSSLDDATVYDPRRDEWSRLPVMPTARRSPRGAPLDGTIYVTGGATNDGPLTTVELWDTATSRWSIGTPLTLPRYAHASVSVNGALYVLGGFRNGQVLNTVERYDPASDRWDALSPLPTPRVHLAAVALHGVIYALGGVGDSRAVTTVEMYDPTTDQWRTGPSMRTAMSNFAAITIDQTIHVLWSHEHDLLDTESETWSTAAPMPTPRHGLGVAVVDGVLYAYGGCHDKLFDLNTVEALPLASLKTGDTDA